MSGFAALNPTGSFFQVSKTMAPVLTANGGDDAAQCV